MKIREEALLDLRYNIYIAILIVILMILLFSNKWVSDKFSELNKRVFHMETEVRYDIISHELPMVISYTKPETQTDSVLKDVFQFILNLFGCKDESPVSLLAAEHPLFLPYDEMIAYLPKTEELDLDFTDEHNTEQSDQMELVVYQPEEENPSHIAYDFNDIPFINETGYDIKKIVQEIMDNPYSFDFDIATDSILIYHTHTTESFVSKVSDIYNSEIYTRSDNQDENICKVGDELYQSLKDYGFSVNHDKTVHDDPYNSSYSNSFQTVSSFLEENPNTGMVIDVHRNALDQDVKMRLTYETSEGTVAKISFVVATGEVGLSHPYWKQNLQVAMRLQAILESLYPGITDPIYISKYRYNQQVTPGAILVEIGAEGNLLEECVRSSKILAQAIHIMLHE